jgi:hypothetical protein
VLARARSPAVKKETREMAIAEGSMIRVSEILMGRLLRIPAKSFQALYHFQTTR